MADEPEPPMKPNCSYPFLDPNFPLVCDFDYTKAYCCGPSPEFDTGNFVECHDGGCLVGFPGLGGQFMSFPQFQDTPTNNVTTLKTALGGTTMSAWVKIAFQQYCGNDEYPPSTAETIVTMGNMSQPCNPEKCKAVIKAFQYGWGTTDQGNRVRVTIMDQEGSEFQEWVQRMGINPEGDTTPIQGKYRMKVQWGWYVTGGAPEDICGQPPQNLGDPGCGGNEDGFLTDNGHFIPKAPPPPGFNSAYIICSPVLYFLTDWVNAHYEQGKFMYEVEGTDALVRAQEQMIQEVFGTADKQRYFTKAVELLGRVSFPQFRVEFKALDALGDVVDMEFVKPDDNLECREFADDGFVDCLGYGPLKVFWPNTKPPLAIIHEWLNQGVLARDLTGKVTSDKSRVGITMNYDPTYKFVPNGEKGSTTTDPCAECSGDQPQYGRLILWANAIPYCQANYNDSEINKRLKAVYIINGGNCLNCYSEILTENGWNYIGNIYRKKYSGNVACVDENGELTWSKINNWYRNTLNNRKMVKVHLHNSRQKTGSVSGAIFTEDHPILTNAGYVEVKSLNITDHKIHSGTCCPSQEVHEAVIGMILGDGNIKISSNSFNCGHCWKQKFYAEHKASLLESQIKEINTGRYPKVKIRNNASPYWRSMAKLFYKHGKKIITENNIKDFTIISLAYLYMDDGSINKKRLAEIATCGFTTEEVDVIIDKIKSLGIPCYRRSNVRWPRIYFDREGTNVLMEKISPYIIEGFDYKIYKEHRLESKRKLSTNKRPFYDTFDLVRCEKLENITKHVYCIDVEKYHNFITHSGVVHNCSPVLSFAPSFRWHVAAAQRTAGNSTPTVGTNVDTRQGYFKANCPIASSPGYTNMKTVTATQELSKTRSGSLQTIESTFHHIMANLGLGAIEADLRVQGDPAYFLCGPIEGMGRCVGIVFVNPFFLEDDPNNPVKDCPNWFAGDHLDPDANFKSNINKLLTNKGWFIFGVDHQIKDGQYITTLKLRLVAPAAELNQAGSITNLGAWDGSGSNEGTNVPYGGRFGCLDKYLVGNAGVSWGNQPGTPHSSCGLWVGGGTACSDNYIIVPPGDLPPS